MRLLTIEILKRTLVFLQSHTLRLPKSRSEDEDVQCVAEKSNDEEPEVCEVPFHGQLNYLLCDSPILNSVETNVVQKNAKSCQQFRCDGCGRAYTRVDSLKRHQQKCDEFLASFQDRQETLERLQQQEYYCNQCGKTYRRLDTLRRHQRLVCGDKEKADQPEEYDALWMLERKAHNIGQKSQESLQPFSSKLYSPLEVYETSVPNDYVTQAHMYSENSYAPMTQTCYICADCGKQYKWMDSLRRHQRVECGNKEKKFSCYVCNRKFKYRFELRKHMKLHYAK
ncbi:zinc finger protein 58-like [Nylanderia fulva]|uniref:zinc finger protein 58-like n=1 Tax=Nylanderia fulva TaxID=613905 RepID=UPI0010FB35B4|nr:zinc finger protein 58-like [Nylanderia fulva]